MTFLPYMYLYHNLDYGNKKLQITTNDIKTPFETNTSKYENHDNCSPQKSHSIQELAYVNAQMSGQSIRASIQNLAQRQSANPQRLQKAGQFLIYQYVVHRQPDRKGKVPYKNL